jgi:sugar lactone lactonase YvrE
MNNKIPFPIIGIAIGAIIALAMGIGVFVWMGIDPSGEQGNRLSKEFDYDLEVYEKIDPALIRYEEKSSIPVGMREARAVAIGPEDCIYVAGDKRIRIFSPEGKNLNDFALEGEPTCLAVGNAEKTSPGRARIFVGMGDHVEVLAADGRRESVWQRPGKRSFLTSIALAEEDVFVADYGAKIVWHYDLQGKLLGEIGRRDKEQDFPGMIVPSPYFDVAVAPDGLLRVVNPGLHRIEAYTFDGHRELSWGQRGMGIEAFCGCCNPSNIAILADGRVVTAEKGIPRVKVYSSEGKFECVVAGPKTLAPNPSALVETREDSRLHPVDLAVDRRSRVLVLDPAKNAVRIFERKEK